MKTPVVAAALRCWRSHKRQLFYFFLAFSSLCVIYIAVYTAYNAKFIVDEIYQGKGPREYTRDEKITVRVIAPKDVSLLKSFVERYSLCQSIEKIYIVTSSPITTSTGKAPATVDEIFTFAHTHCPVEIRNVLDASNLDALGSNLEIHTKDPAVVVDCEHISYMQSVLRSSGTSAVGLYPALHSVVNSHTLAYYSGLYVWWHSSYSMLQSHAIAVSTDIWKSLNDASSTSTAIRSVLNQHPHCYNIAVSVYNTYKHHTPPIWTDVPTSMLTASSAAKNSDMSECLTLLYNALSKPHLPHSWLPN